MARKTAAGLDPNGSKDWFGITEFSDALRGGIDRRVVRAETERLRSIVTPGHPWPFMSTRYGPKREEPK